MHGSKPHCCGYAWCLMPKPRDATSFYLHEVFLSLEGTNLLTFFVEQLEQVQVHVRCGSMCCSAASRVEQFQVGPAKDTCFAINDISFKVCGWSGNIFKHKRRWSEKQRQCKALQITGCSVQHLSPSTYRHGRHGTRLQSSTCACPARQTPEGRTRLQEGET